MHSTAVIHGHIRSGFFEKNSAMLIWQGPTIVVHHTAIKLAKGLCSFNLSALGSNHVASKQALCHCFCHCHCLTQPRSILAQIAARCFLFRFLARKPCQHDVSISLWTWHPRTSAVMSQFQPCTVPAWLSPLRPSTPDLLAGPET